MSMPTKDIVALKPVETMLLSVKNRIAIVFPVDSTVVGLLDRYRLPRLNDELEGPS
jgi:hypothetical protein